MCYLQPVTKYPQGRETRGQPLKGSEVNWHISANFVVFIGEQATYDQGKRTNVRGQQTTPAPPIVYVCSTCNHRAMRANNGQFGRAVSDRTSSLSLERA